jgi:dethiobiotin synthase
MRRVVVTESIFGMDGDLAPLERLNELCERHDAWLVVDEAHAAGLLGREGAGAWAATAIDRRADSRLAARVVTGGKALGVGGAFVVGSAALRDLLLHRARAFVYTTSPPPVVAGALIAAIDAARRADEARARVLALAHRLAVGLRGGASARASVPAGAVVIEPVGDARAAVERGDRLLRDGFAVGVVRPPTVPQGGSRLRIVAHAFNDEAAADELVHRVVALRAPHVRIEVRDSSSPTWFVVGTDTNVGKTIVSALLVRAAKRLGPAAYWKPVQTGTDDDTATVRALAGAREDELLPNAAHFALPASPHEAAAAEGAAIEPAQLAWPGALAGRRAIVELAGGLLVPYRGGAEPWLQADWLESRRARVLLVARSGLGTLNHTLLTLEALRARHLEAEALFLVGPPHASNAATLRELSGVARVHEVPTFSPLATAALDAWLDQHDLRDLLEST